MQGYKSWEEIVANVFEFSLVGGKSVGFGGFSLIGQEKF